MNLKDAVNREMKKLVDQGKIVPSRESVHRPERDMPF